MFFEFHFILIALTLALLNVLGINILGVLGNCFWELPGCKSPPSQTEPPFRDCTYTPEITLALLNCLGINFKKGTYTINMNHQCNLGAPKGILSCQCIKSIHRSILSFCLSYLSRSIGTGFITFLGAFYRRLCLGLSGTRFLSVFKGGNSNRSRKTTTCSTRKSFSGYTFMFYIANLIFPFFPSIPSLLGCSE